MVNEFVVGKFYKLSDNFKEVDITTSYPSKNYNIYFACKRKVFDNRIFRKCISVRNTESISESIAKFEGIQNEWTYDPHDFIEQNQPINWKKRLKK